MSNAEANEEFYQQETEELRKALSEAVDLILNTKTGQIQIGPFCRAAAERWQKLLDGERDEASLR